MRSTFSSFHPRVLLSSSAGIYKRGSPPLPTVSPLLADTFVGLPPAYIQINGGDPLRDEGLLYVQRLEEEGVKVKLDMYAFTFFLHSFAILRHAYTQIVILFPSLSPTCFLYTISLGH